MLVTSNRMCVLLPLLSSSYHTCGLSSLAKQTFVLQNIGCAREAAEWDLLWHVFECTACSSSAAVFACDVHARAAVALAVVVLRGVVVRVLEAVYFAPAVGRMRSLAPAHAA